MTAIDPGSEDAFRELVEPHRAELHALCYRMLGSVHDADDALQDALLRAWRALPGFEGRSTLRAWLYRIATNASLRAIERQPKRVLPIDYGRSAARGEAPGEPLVESVWIEPYPDSSVAEGYAAPDARYERRESVELAFVAAMQHLPARQRAALILRDVLGFSADETAAALQTTTASVNSALQRARKAADERLPDRSQQATLRALGDERVRAIVERYMAAMEAADVDAVVAMLADEAAWSMPPMKTWYRGRKAIAAFLADWPFTTDRWRHTPTHANGQLAVGCYTLDPSSGRYRAALIDVLTLRGDRIAEVTAFVDPDLPVRFGLPAELPPRPVPRRRRVGDRPRPFGYEQVLAAFLLAAKRG